SGLLGDDRDVPWVVARGETATLRRAASFALARIRTPAALDALRTWAKEAAALSTRDPAAARMYDYLLSAAFPEAERIAGRLVGPRARPGATSDPQPGPGEAKPGR